MDRQCNYHIPGTLLGHLRHRAEGRGWRWRKLPHQAGAGSDTGADSRTNPESDSGTNSRADTETNPGAYTESGADSNSYPGADTDTFGDAKRNADANSVTIAQRDSDTDAVAKRDGNPIAKGNAFGASTSRLADPHKGSGGRHAALPAAAQAAGRTARPYGSCV